METRANYALMGVFTLAVIAAAFGFVLWFSGAEKPGGRTTYKIIFTGSISGLSDGGVVLFNGVRVGAVTKIDLVPQDPSRVFALIEVDAKVPVRTDTRARLEYTGFTGVASVALTGGALDAPPLPATQGPAVIVADRSDYQDLVETARRVATQASDFFTKTNRGGLSTATARKLEQAAADPLGRGAVKPAPPISLRPGTRLVREWRGVTHMVLIHADGIEWRGQRYRSLSLVARKITGARWSGPRFFGLRQRPLDSTSTARAGHGQG
jgi:hypothetical protein